jgi:hypothetical protein
VRWRTTHSLVCELEGHIADLYRWRGQYYTSEGWHAGEPGITLSDIGASERIVRVKQERKLKRLLTC